MNSAVSAPGIGPWRTLRRRFYWLLSLLLLTCAVRMPLAAGRALGRTLALWAFRLRSREVAIARGNLAWALPDLSDSEREQLLHRSVRALGENMHDTLAAPRWVGREGFVIERNGAGSLRQVLNGLARRRKGILILTGHLGCWELLGAWLARQIPAAGLGTLAVVTGTIHNPAVDDLVQRRRREAGLKVLPREDGVRPLLEHLRQGGVAAVLLDQNTRVPNRPVPFFGRPAPTPVGFAKLALRLGMPILPVAIARHGEGHEVVVLPPILPEIGSEENSEELDELLGRCNRALEEMIRRNPAEWVWFHRRWEEANPQDLEKSIVP